MKMKDSRLIGSVYRVDSERIVGINLGHDMICELSKLLTGNRNKIDSIEASVFTNLGNSGGYDVMILRDEQRFEIFVPNNKVNFSFNIPRDIKPKAIKEEELVEQTIPEEIEAESVSSPEFSAESLPSETEHILPA